MEIQGWELIEHIGEGGNSSVFRAMRDQETVALKVLKKVDASSESYLRFRDEVAILRNLKSHPGILPILDANIPAAPNKQNRAWLAMPLADPIKKHLGDHRSLSQVVYGILAVAQTLSSLAERGISHRDIKPENLYFFDGEWVVGDFGLAEFPGKDAITDNGRALGPRFYIAPEMISDPTNAVGTCADVYSLSKTLWVLAVNQNYPPPGPQMADVSQISLCKLVPHPHASELDHLIERSTRHSPDRRPSMRMFADELKSWTLLPTDIAQPQIAMPFLSSLKRQLYDETQRLQSITWIVTNLYIACADEHLKSIERMLADSGLSPAGNGTHGESTGYFRAEIGYRCLETRGRRHYRIKFELGGAATADLRTLSLKASVELTRPDIGSILFEWNDKQDLDIESSYAIPKLDAMAAELRGKVAASTEILFKSISTSTAS